MQGPGGLVVAPGDGSLQGDGHPGHGRRRRALEQAVRAALEDDEDDEVLELRALPDRRETVGVVVDAAQGHVSPRVAEHINAVLLVVNSRLREGTRNDSLAKAIGDGLEAGGETFEAEGNMFSISVLHVVVWDGLFCAEDIGLYTADGDGVYYVTASFAPRNPADRVRTALVSWEQRWTDM